VFCCTSEAKGDLQNRVRFSARATFCCSLREKRFQDRENNSLKERKDRMKVTIESTTKIVQLNGVPARIWMGTTESGIKMHAFIARVAIGKDEDGTQFEKELQECAIPSEAIQAYPLSLII
jgi:hypothetical protein